MRLVARRAPFAAAVAAGFFCAAAAVAQDATSIALPAASPAFATTYIAADLDIFGERGLRAKLGEGAAADSPEPLFKGDADWVFLSGGALARAAAGGQKLLAVANLLERPLLEIVLRKNFADQGRFVPGGPVATRGKLLRGRAIGVETAGGAQEGWTRIVARKAGLDPDKDVRFVVMPAETFAGAMAEGKIDGFAAAVSWTLVAARDGTGVVLASALTEDAPEILPIAWSALTTRPDTCATRKFVCEKIVRTYVEGARIVRDEPLRTTLVLKRRFPALSDDLIKGAIDAVRRATPIFPAVTAQGLANAEAFAVASGALKPSEALKSFEGLFTTEYVR